MDALITLIIIGAIISKFVKAFGKNNEKKSVKQTQPNQKRQPVQQRPQQNAYYYNNKQKATKERLQQKYGSQQKPAQKSDILAKAKGNVQEKAQDTIQQQMHAEVCRDYRDTSHVMPDVKVHKEQSAECDTGETSDIMKRVNDLIVTGYSGDMNFERDFIAEGVDMLNRYSL